MNTTTLLIAALITLPVVGVLIGVGFAIAQVVADLRSFNGFEGLHFEF